MVKRHSVLGEVVLPLNIGGLHISQKFIVIEKLHHKVILGLDFMTTNHVRIDFHNRLLSVGEDTVTVALLCDSKFGYARPEYKVTIPANSELAVPVRLSGGHKNATVLLEPTSDLNEMMLACARTLVLTRNSRTKVRVMNPTDRDINLSPRVVLANVNKINSAEIYSLNENTETVSNLNIDNENNDNLQFEINNTKLSETEKQKLKQFLCNNNDVFSTSLASIGKTNIFTHKIETIPGASPVHLPPHRVDPIKKKEIERQTAEMTVRQGTRSSY